MDTTCYGDNSYFTNLSTISGPYNIINWTWDFGDGQTSILENPTHNYINEGPYNVQLIIETDSGCFDDTTLLVEVHSFPIAGYSPLISCTNINTHFSDESSVNSASISNWLWIIDEIDSLFIQNPTYLFVDSGYHSVKLITTSNFGCIDTIVDTLFAKPGPLQAFTYSQ